VDATVLDSQTLKAELERAVDGQAVDGGGGGGGGGFDRVIWNFPCIAGNSNGNGRARFDGSGRVRVGLGSGRFMARIRQKAQSIYTSTKWHAR
jgi:hypothetical protein